MLRDNCLVNDSVGRLGMKYDNGDEGYKKASIMLTPDGDFKDEEEHLNNIDDSLEHADDHFQVMYGL